MPRKKGPATCDDPFHVTYFVTHFAIRRSPEQVNHAIMSSVVPRERRRCRGSAEFISSQHKESGPVAPGCFPRAGHAKCVRGPWSRWCCPRTTPPAGGYFRLLLFLHVNQDDPGLRPHLRIKDEDRREIGHGVAGRRRPRRAGTTRRCRPSRNGYEILVMRGQALVAKDYRPAA